MEGGSWGLNGVSVQPGWLQYWQDAGDEGE